MRNGEGEEYLEVGVEAGRAAGPGGARGTSSLRSHRRCHQCYLLSANGDILNNIYLVKLSLLQYVLLSVFILVFLSIPSIVC